MSDLKIPDKIPEEESKLRRILFKIFLIIVSLFLLFLFISYLVPGNYILNILEGRIVSAELNEDLTLNLKNEKVIFKPEVYFELRDLYFKEQKNEFKVCLIGYKIENDYYISDLDIPKTYDQSFASVTANLCNKNTIIPLHSHPYKHCIFSQQDIKSYEAFKEINQDAIIGLMCEVNRFNFYIK